MNNTITPEAPQNQDQAAYKPAINATAKAFMVNRTHRVIRERAKAMQTRRSKARSLWIPLLVCSSLILIFCSAVWSVLDEYELTPTGFPDASNQFFVLLLWFFPVSVALLALVWFRRTHTRSEEGAAQ